MATATGKKKGKKTKSISQKFIRKERDLCPRKERRQEGKRRCEAQTVGDQWTSQRGIVQHEIHGTPFVKPWKLQEPQPSKVPRPKVELFHQLEPWSLGTLESSSKNKTMASGAITSKKVRVDPRITESRNLAGAQILLSLFCFLLVSDYDQDSEKCGSSVCIRTETRDTDQVGSAGPQVRRLSKILPVLILSDLRCIYGPPGSYIVNKELPRLSCYYIQ